jgi:hypothetical protein
MHGLVLISGVMPDFELIRERRESEFSMLCRWFEDGRGRGYPARNPTTAPSPCIWDAEDVSLSKVHIGCWYWVVLMGMEVWGRNFQEIFGGDDGWRKLKFSRLLAQFISCRPTVEWAKEFPSFLQFINSTSSDSHHTSPGSSIHSLTRSLLIISRILTVFAKVAPFFAHCLCFMRDLGAFPHGKSNYRIWSSIVEVD